MANKSMKVLVVARSKAISEAVAQFVQPPVEIVEAKKPPFPQGVDLVILERHATLEKFYNDLKALKPAADIVMMLPGGKLTKQFKFRSPPTNLAQLSYREVTERSANLANVEYLRSLLVRHGGNVTEAAKTAKVQRESLHRLLKRHGLKAAQFRVKKAKR